MQTFSKLEDKVAINRANAIRETFIIYALLPYVCFPFLCWVKFCSGCLDSFFSFGGQNKWLLVALDRWSSCTVTILWEFAWMDSALIVLDKWPSYRGGRLYRYNWALIWYLSHTQTHTYSYTHRHTTHSGAHRLAHPYKYIHPYKHYRLVCAHSNYLYYTECLFCSNITFRSKWIAMNSLM